MEKVLQYILEVSRTKSISQAAKNLYISQPALSAIIKKQEDEWGVVLFDRSTKPIHLTECGEYCVKCIEQMQSVESEMLQYFDDLTGLSTGCVRIGASTYYCSNVLPSLISDFSLKYPNIQFSVTECNSTPEIKDMLDNGQIDLILTSDTFSKDEYEQLEYDSEAIIIAVPKSHDVNNSLSGFAYSYNEMALNNGKDDLHPALSLSVFKDEEFITIDHNSDIYPRLLDMFHEIDATPKIKGHFQQMFSCYFMAANGFGSTILRASTLQCVKDTSNLYFYRIDSSYSMRTSKLYYRKKAYLPKAASEFIAFISQMAPLQII